MVDRLIGATERRPLGLLSDEELLDRIRGADAGALGALYDRHARAAFSVARWLTNDRSRAELLVRDGFLALWRSSEASAGAWSC